MTVKIFYFNYTRRIPNNDLKYCNIFQRIGYSTVYEKSLQL
jgi:hypothetical protein